MAVIFVYGINEKRLKQRIEITGTNSPSAALLFLLYGLLSAAILCFVRRVNRLLRDGFISSYIDALICFVGGGNLRIYHRQERWIFGILFIGSFFSVPFWFNTVYFSKFLIRDQTIDTFKELSAKNPPIFSAQIFEGHQKLIEEMLRYFCSNQFHILFHLF